MSLKELIFNDIDSVFLNLDDFAEEHEVNGITLLCIVDDDRLIERTDAAAQGTYLGEKLLFLKASDLPGKPSVGFRMTLDGELYYVRACAENMGMYEIRLGTTRT